MAGGNASAVRGKHERLEEKQKKKKKKVKKSR